MRSLFGLESKTFLVVGGGQGMGEATAKILAGLGANIAVLDLEPDRAKRVATEVAAMGVKAIPVDADVTDEAAVVGAVARAEQELAPLDGMASIVGMAAWSSLLEMTAETWDLDHRRNLRYFFFAAREVARSLHRRKAPGSIVGVGSVDGLVSSPYHASYGAAKAGLVNLVKSMALEWADNGIRVNLVAPGAIATPRNPVQEPERERKAMGALPLKRRGSTDDIAKAVAFFLSDLSPYVTGQTLAVDGGYTAKGIFEHRTSLPSGATMGMAGAKLS